MQPLRQDGRQGAVGGGQEMRGGMDVRRVPYQERERQRWFDFLTQECTRRDGLLCFYDREKSPGVLSCCLALARHLEAPSAAPPAGPQAREREEEPGPWPVAPWGPG